MAFQAVLIPGAFLSGFLLSPLLVISRHVASRPSHRLKWPTERELHRKLLALGVAIGLFGIVFLMLGGWAGWMLGTNPTTFLRRLRRPWGWAARFLWYGNSDGVDVDGLARHLRGQSEPWWSPRRNSRGWRRVALVGYWGATISSAIGGWQTHLVRARRIRMRTLRTETASAKGSDGKDSGSPAPTDSASTRQGAAAAGKRFIGRGIDAVQAARANVGGAQQPPLRFGAEHAREEKAVHASLNLRRKFFHALAALMFVPGIAIDVSDPLDLVSLQSVTANGGREMVTAGFHLARLLRRLLALHLRGIRALLCALPDRRAPAHLFHRVCRLEGQRTRHS